MNKAEGALRKLKRAIELIPDREPATVCILFDASGFGSADSPPLFYRC